MWLGINPSISLPQIVILNKARGQRQETSSSIQTDLFSSLSYRQLALLCVAMEMVVNSKHGRGGGEEWMGPSYQESTVSLGLIKFSATMQPVWAAARKYWTCTHTVFTNKQPEWSEEWSSTDEGVQAVLESFILYFCMTCSLQTQQTDMWCRHRSREASVNVRTEKSPTKTPAIICYSLFSKINCKGCFTI